MKMELFEKKHKGERLKNKIFQSRDLCLRALDANLGMHKKRAQK